MAMNKKSMFFTLTTLVLITILLFYPYRNTYVFQRTYEAEKRIYALNNYIKNLERDIERGLYISSFRALYALTEEIASSGEFLNNTESDFYSAVMNGTINNKPFFILQDSTLQAWIAKVESEGNKLHINTRIEVNGIRLYQKNPWLVTFGANITLNISDNAETASWLRTTYVETNINITGFEDPLYIVNGLGRLTNPINQSPYDGNFIDGINVSNLMNHVGNSYYIVYNLSPDFLMRFEGNLSNSSYGIESMVNLPKFTAQGIPVTQRSIVDSVYWSEDNPTIYRINNTPSWFRVDVEHLNRYGLAGAILP